MVSLLKASMMLFMMLFLPSMLSTGAELGRSSVLDSFSQSVRLLRKDDGKNRNLGKHRDHFSGAGVYVMDIAIGTPPQSFQVVIDTGSDLIWTQCGQCRSCISQPDPLFDPQNSSSFAILSCSHDLCRALPIHFCSQDSECIYSYRYGGGTTTRGPLGTETFTFGSEVQIRELAFGCGEFNSGPLANSSGILGLGRGSLSLVSQVNLRRFSLCFAPSSDGISAAGYIFLGSSAQLKGITVGETLLSIPSSVFKLKEDGSGGTIIDSGSTALYLNEVAYEQLSKTFISQLGMTFVNTTGSKDPELCFKPPQYHVMPSLILHFKDADWSLSAENYVKYIEELDQPCVAIKKAGEDGTTIIGNYATQNMHVLYDLEKERLSFVPAKCSQI